MPYQNKVTWSLNEVDDLILNVPNLPRVVLYPVEGLGCRLAFDCGDFEAEVVHPEFGPYFLNGIDAAISLLDDWEVDKSQLLVKTDLFRSNR